MQYRFPHSKLVAWQVAIDLAKALRPLIAKLKRRDAVLADQLTRAGRSVPLNLAEGAARWTDRDKAHRFTIARGEAAEVAGALEVAVALGALEEAETKAAMELADRVCALLTGMIRRCRA